MQSVVLVFLGAGAGGVLRHLVNLAAVRWFGAGFPWGTLAVNVVGGFCMGVLAGVLAARIGEFSTNNARLLLATGVLGGFTTFSAFSLDAWLLWERGEAALAVVYVVASVVGAIGALGLGMFVARSLA
jgi:CrcB protein